MDPHLEQLEADLARLKPAPVPAKLDATIVAGFTAAPASEADNIVEGPWSTLQRLGAAAAVLVAGIGVFFAVLNQFGPNSGSPGTIVTRATVEAGSTETPLRPRSALVPVSADNVFEGVRDEGIILSSDNIPMRQLRYRFTDSMLLENPEDGSEVQLSMPREHLYLVPVQTD